MLALGLLLAACPAPTGTRGSGGASGGTAAAVDPDACGTINTTNEGRKLYAFLVASAELDHASSELEGSVHDACRKMAIELGTPVDGSTSELCRRASQALDANLQVSVKTENRLVTRYTPPVCHTDLYATAGFVAQCEASTTASVAVTCKGRCNGTCNGTCSTPGTGGQCAGECSGQCQGQCEGYADVNATGECRAAAEIHASVTTTCSEPKVEVVRQDVTVIDDSKFQHAVAAINAGMPQILLAARRLELAGEALGHWASTGASLVASTADLIGDLGDKALCVTGQLASAVAATAVIQTRFSVSIEVTAQVSASAGATAR